jgi:RNA polymerase sigma-70 factor (ECF subfamily)
MPPPDPASLTAWFDAHAAQLVLYARQWLAPGSAEDVVQEVFIRLMARRPAPDNVKAWLFRSVRNAAISESRSRRRRKEREHYVAAARGEWFAAKADDLIDAAAAQEALASLAAEQREVVILRIWAALTLQEISESIGMPLSTVYDHYRAALSAIRKKMESSCRNKVH